jgi:choline dehydrogenase-like flavoprotein
MPDNQFPPVVVYGAGAIGGLLAARLRLAGTDVTAVARGEHLRAIRTAGLTVVSEAGESTVDLPVAADAGEVDWSAGPVVVLAVKSHQTQAALEDLAAHAPGRTPVFVAQNGVANEAAVLRRFATCMPSRSWFLLRIWSRESLSSRATRWPASSMWAGFRPATTALWRNRCRLLSAPPGSCPRFVTTSWRGNTAS